MPVDNGTSRLDKERVKQLFGAVEAILSGLGVEKYETPIEFFCRLGLDIGKTPYLREVLEYLSTRKGVEADLMFSERLGKTIAVFSSMLYRLKYHPEWMDASMIVYKSDDFARTVNETKFEPLIAKVPEFKRELEQPFAMRKDFYNIGGKRVYFQGSGRDIIGLDIPFRYADEADFWEDCDGAAGRVNNLVNLRKRGFTFDYAMFVKSSSPKTEAGRIWHEFKYSSRGYWHLRCQKCGGLTMRSCDVHNLTWRTSEDFRVVPETLRLVCPACKHPHTEAERFTMNAQGDYVHESPDLINTHVGWQVGALASQMPAPEHTWLGIAVAQMAAGKSGSIGSQSFLDNTIRGLPFRPRRGTAKEFDLKEHCGESPKPEDIANIFVGVDTQDDCYYYTVTAVDRKWNFHVIKWGRVPADGKELLQIYRTRYFGEILPVAMIIDEGGHRANDVANLRKLKGVYSYKGGLSSKMKKWSISKTDPKRLLANKPQLQADLLYYLFSQPNKANHYLFFAQNIDAEFLASVSDYRPAKNLSAERVPYEKWVPSANNISHYFDCLKETYMLVEYAKKYFAPSQWRRPKQDGEQANAKPPSQAAKPAHVPYVDPFAH